MKLLFPNLITNFTSFCENNDHISASNQNELFEIVNAILEIKNKEINNNDYLFSLFFIHKCLCSYIIKIEDNFDCECCRVLEKVDDKIIEFREKTDIDLYYKTLFETINAYSSEANEQWKNLISIHIFGLLEFKKDEIQKVFITQERRIRKSVTDLIKFNLKIYDKEKDDDFDSRQIFKKFQILLQFFSDYYAFPHKGRGLNKKMKILNSFVTNPDFRLKTKIQKIAKNLELMSNFGYENEGINNEEILDYLLKFYYFFNNDFEIKNDFSIWINDILSRDIEHQIRSVHFENSIPKFLNYLVLFFQNGKYDCTWHLFFSLLNINNDLLEKIIINGNPIWKLAILNSLKTYKKEFNDNFDNSDFLLRLITFLDK